MRRYKVAAILMIVHGGAIELGGCLSLALASLLRDAAFAIEQYFSYKFAISNFNS